MRGIPSAGLFLFFALIFFVELISYLGIRLLMANFSRRRKTICNVAYSGILMGTTSLFLYAFSNPELIQHSRNYNLFFVVIIVAVLNLIPKFFFSILAIVSFLVRYILGKRQQIIILMGSFILSISIFLIIFYGVFFNRYQVTVREENLYFDNLPSQFDGLRIEILSDIHLGTFNGNARVMKETVSFTKALNPDLLLFTGDIVNNFSYEMSGFESYLSQLSAKYGKFAILGNHDYGDYYRWSDQNAKADNLEEIKSGLVNSGFQLLLNQSTKIALQDTSIELIGVENWGHKPFPQYADLSKAMNDVPEKSFKILMSHDPAHWESAVSGKTTIPLTLSGHTHGGQFGIKIAGVEFSPIYLIQKCWGGLYKSGNQYLYVNRGLGTVGFAGRIEMNPEITLLVLHRTKTR